MNRHLDVDRVIEDWLADLPNSLPDRVVNRLVDDLDRTPQWRRFALPWRDQMNRFVMAAGAVAAIALVAVIGIGLVSGGGGLFGASATTAPSPAAQSTPQPTVTPTPEPTEPPSPEPTTAPSPRPSAQLMPEGNLQPGTYFAHPADLQGEGNPLTVTFTVPDGWAGLAHYLILSGNGLELVEIQLRDVANLNGDPCHWSGTSDDVDAGTTVDDLVEALVAQTDYEVSDPVDVNIGGYSGKRVDIIHPAAAFAGPDSDGNYSSPECDDDQYRIWNDGIYGQGPDNRWQANILDVDGTRLVVVAMDYPQTSAESRAELDALIDSLVIEP